MLTKPDSTRRMLTLCLCSAEGDTGPCPLQREGEKGDKCAMKAWVLEAGVHCPCCACAVAGPFGTHHSSSVSVEHTRASE